MAWRVANAAVLAAAFAHFLIDWHIGLFGASMTSISPLQAALVWSVAALTGCWAYALAAGSHGSKTALINAAVFSGGWGFLGNGLPILACLPPCEGAFPHQDIAHVASLVFGAMATVGAVGAAKKAAGRVRRSLVLAAVALVAAVFAMESVLAYA